MQKSTGLSLFQIDESRHLEQHDERDTKAELYMLRLVPKAFHPAKGPHSAAKDDKKEQDLFGNAPFIMDGTVLIIGVDEEGRHIDDSKIRQNSGWSRMARMTGYPSALRAHQSRGRRRHRMHSPGKGRE